MKTNLRLMAPVRTTKAKSVVILTSYGRDALLDRAIRSVLTQSDEDLILLIVDDNSPTINKKTHKIIHRHTSDKRVIFFNAETNDVDRKKVSTFTRNINFMLRYAKDHLRVKYVSYIP